MSPIPLHQTLNLYITPDLYIFEPTDLSHGSEANRLLTINPSAKPPAQSFRALTVYGIMGLLTLSTTEYLVVITGRAAIRGRINDHTLYHATEFRVLPVATPASNHLMDHPVEKHLVDLVEKHLADSVLWFSYGFEITRTLQSQYANPSAGKPMWEAADDRFFWNKFLQSRLIDASTSNPDLHPFILPVIYGSVEVRQTHIGRIPFDLVLISRRSRYRAGTRYFTRGVNAKGHVANFNETEQIILIDPDEGDARGGYGGLADVQGTTKLSFVQTRGSVPVYWAEINTLRYIPDLLIMDKEDTGMAFNLHIDEQVKTYGPQTLVNLVKAKGREKQVKEAYERQVKKADRSDVNYEFFDFAAECKAMRFDKVQILLDRMAPLFPAMGYFHSNNKSEAPLKQQIGVIRSNCMDCLDRTNVVQSAFAKLVLAQQLRDIGVLSEKESLDDHEDFISVFRNVWADHADYVSKAYSGTGALKTDFTRTGIRTRQGLLMDGQNSTMRFIKNNFFDGDRQDAYDLFTGAWVPRRGPAAGLSIITDARPLVTRSMPWVLAFSLFMIVAAISLPRTSTYSLFYYVLFWFTLVALSAVYILGHGLEYVAWPRLNRPTEFLFYEGPGFRSGNHGKGFKIPFNLDRRLVKGGIRIGGSLTTPISSHRHSKTEEIEMGLKKRTD
ncbi:hypothetical protein DL93DRAFT_2165436 [Clavulina sp. PMI_390]|nr:hypothetical protein DL93DRAFT_2165436 [Clavulina sp. PMI_390]